MGNKPVAMTVVVVAAWAATVAVVAVVAEGSVVSHESVSRGGGHDQLSGSSVHNARDSVGSSARKLSPEDQEFLSWDEMGPDAFAWEDAVGGEDGMGRSGHRLAAAERRARTTFRDRSSAADSFLEASEETVLSASDPSELRPSRIECSCRFVDQNSKRVEAMVPTNDEAPKPNPVAAESATAPETLLEADEVPSQTTKTRTHMRARAGLHQQSMLPP